MLDGTDPPPAVFERRGVCREGLGFSGLVEILQGGDVPADGLAVEGLEDDAFVDAEGGKDDAGVPSGEQSDAVQDHVAAEGALRLGGIHHLNRSRRDRKVGAGDLQPRVRGQVCAAPGGPVLQGGRHFVEQDLKVERFFQEIKGTGLDGDDRCFDASVSAHHDDGKLRGPLLEPLQELHAVHARKPHIEQDERWFYGVELLPEALGIGKDDGLVSLVLQDTLDRGADGRFVVYDADRVHRRPGPIFVPDEDRMGYQRPYTIYHRPSLHKSKGPECKGPEQRTGSERQLPDCVLFWNQDLQERTGRFVKRGAVFWFILTPE